MGWDSREAMIASMTLEEAQLLRDFYDRMTKAGLDPVKGLAALTEVMKEAEPGITAQEIGKRAADKYLASDGS